VTTLAASVPKETETPVALSLEIPSTWPFPSRLTNVLLVRRVSGNWSGLSAEDGMADLMTWYWRTLRTERGRQSRTTTS
jgi:hypothetical protein